MDCMCYFSKIFFSPSLVSKVFLRVGNSKRKSDKVPAIYTNSIIAHN